MIKIEMLQDELAKVRDILEKELKKTDLEHFTELLKSWGITKDVTSDPINGTSFDIEVFENESKIEGDKWATAEFYFDATGKFNKIVMIGD